MEFEECVKMTGFCSTGHRCKENNTIFEGVYLKDSRTDLAQIWSRPCPTLRFNFVQKLLKYGYMKIVFSGSCKSTVECPNALAFLGRMTYYCVS